ncbi:uncharacterized protein [Haliotis asinina]|uniref:uncharacterized protein n=1 Tax=Haliotis asinina TaxID=109174 RepID=UPI0035317F62
MRLIFFFAVGVSAVPSSSGLPSCRDIEKFSTECLAQVQGTPLGRLFANGNFSYTNVTAFLSDIRTTFCQPQIKADLKNLYGCFQGKVMTCLPSDWRRVIPPLDQAIQAFDYTCNNINDVDAPCLESDRSMIATNCLRDVFQERSNFSTPDEFVTFDCRYSKNVYS